MESDRDEISPAFSGRFPLHRCTVAETPSLISATIKFIICRYLGNHHPAELKTINFSYSKDGLLIHSDAPIVEAVEFHHEPAKGGVSGVRVLTAVHVANVIEREEERQEGSIINSELDSE